MVNVLMIYIRLGIIKLSALTNVCLHLILVDMPVDMRCLDRKRAVVEGLLEVVTRFVLLL